MNKSDFFYDLPQELIAQTPAMPRDSSRMLVYSKQDMAIDDKHFYDIVDFLKEGDLLIVNQTKVIPARIVGQKASGGHVEFLLHKRINYTDWEVLAKPAKRAKIGDEFVFSDKLKCTIIGDGDEGIRKIKFSFDGIFEDLLSQVGEMPLPHYITQKPDDPARYQTVYAVVDGACAAPTAGLHFTDEIMERLEKKGVQIAKVLLHVGLGTFRPVKVDDILDHKMHSEYYEISNETIDKINAAKKEGRRVIAVGTTSVRVLESVADRVGEIDRAKDAESKSGDTDIFIYPSYKFKIVDALITNFHLPESTLIMLVSAFLSHEETMRIYKHAVDNKYRFFSFGDACFFY